MRRTTEKEAVAGSFDAGPRHAGAPTHPHMPPSPPSLAGAHPLGGDAARTAVFEIGGCVLGSRRQPLASRGISILLGRCLRRQVLLTRHTPCPQPPPRQPATGEAVTGRGGHWGDQGVGKRREPPAMSRAAAAASGAAAAGGRVAPAAASRTGTGDGGGAEGRSRLRVSAAQRPGGGAHGSGGPGG